MLRDPLYRAIEKRLSEERLDPELFERCAADLLGTEYAGLAPVRGGGDAGMDGSIPSADSAPVPLVCTTGKDVIANLTRSLHSYMKHGGGSRSVVLATSQSLSPTRRRNLENRARELGFTLLNIHAQDDFVNRLYRSAEWRLELLGLTGDPPALSALPRSQRPFASQPLLGREPELEWIRTQGGDCLLVGQPGAGKTAVLSTLALIGEGLFVITDELGRVADAVRTQVPNRIFVDDAHRRQDLLLELRTLREEIGAAFRIVATCWPGEREALQRSMGLPVEAVRDLPLLPRKVMADIVRATGITGPDLLIAEILNQAQGRPGLAVTLSLLSLQQGTADLATGQFLYHDIVRDLRGLVGEKVVPVLAAFAVGGRAGMQMATVAQALSLSVVEVWDMTTQIAAGGVLRETPGKTLAVEPAALRDALIRSVFFAGAHSLPIGPLLDAAPDRACAALVLARARQRGTNVPDALLRAQLEGCIPSSQWLQGESRKAWLTYAYSGPEAVDWILDHYPDLLDVIAWAGLAQNPGRTIRLLLAQAVGDDRELPGHPEHPLRILQDWVKAGRPATDAALDRRRHVLDVLLHSAREGTVDPDVARRTLPIVFTPEYDVTEDDPITQDAFTFQSSHLTSTELQMLLARWPDALEILRIVGLDGTRELDPLVRLWAFPGMLRGHVSDEVIEVARTGAEQMLEDIAALGRDHSGIVTWTARLAERAGLTPSLPEDREADFQVLFPKEDFRGDHTARLRRQHAAADELAARWAGENPTTVAARLTRYDREAVLSGHRWPWLTDVAAEGIARRAADQIEWIDALVANEARPELVAPFLQRMMEAGGGQVGYVWHRLFDTVKYRWLCLSVALRAPSLPDDVLARTLASISKAPELVEWACLRSEVPAGVLARLLQHEAGAVAAAAAKGVWAAGEPGQVPADLYKSWRSAVVEHVKSDYILEAVFAHDPTIARDWLVARAREDEQFWSRHDDAFEKAVSVLDVETRRELLSTLRAGAGPVGLFGMLVGDNPELFRILLSRKELESVHLEPLYGRPTQQWAKMVKIALEAGYSPAELASAPHSLGWSWTGNESAMWQGWVDAFAPLEEHQDGRIREIGRLGREWAERQRDAAAEREHAERVYGLS